MNTYLLVVQNKPGFEWMPCVRGGEETELHFLQADTPEQALEQFVSVYSHWRETIEENVYNDKDPHTGISIRVFHIIDEAKDIWPKWEQAVFKKVKAQK
jgi:hypothetical protein